MDCKNCPNGASQPNPMDDSMFEKSIAMLHNLSLIHILGDWCRNYIFYPLSISKRFLNFGKWLKPRFGAHISKVLPGCIASCLLYTSTAF